MRAEGLKQTPFAALSRGLCGTIGTSLVLNVPGNPKGAEASLKSVLHLVSHALDLLAGKTEH
jgi:molybdopterin biosynthesis enzyme MoaB